MGDGVVPGESTILRLRPLLDQHGLAQAIFTSITGLLEERRLFRARGRLPELLHGQRRKTITSFSKREESATGSPAPYLSAVFERALAQDQSARSRTRARGERAFQVTFGLR
jgi:hypothetical protein